MVLQDYYVTWELFPDMTGDHVTSSVAAAITQVQLWRVTQTNKTFIRYVPSLNSCL